MAAMAARAAQLETSLFERLSAGLYASTSLSRRTASPFDGFGIAAVTRIAPQAPHRDAGFTLAEARERIREFFEDTFNPKRLGELIEYLTGKGLRLEARRARDGSTAHYLVDAASEKSLLAATVDRRLSRQGIARMFGSTLEQEAEAVRQATRRSPEQIAAQKIRNQNAGRLLLGDADARPFDDWEDVRFSASSMFGGREVTVQGGEIWLGSEYAAASSDPQVNLALIARARAEGTPIIVPARSPEDARAGRFVPGLPVLLKEGAVRTKLIDERLSYAGLARQFGATIYDYAAEIEKRHAKRTSAVVASGATPVVDLDSFRKRFSRPRAAEVPAERIAAPAAVDVRRHARFSIRQETGVDGRETLSMVDLGNGRSEPFDPVLAGAGKFPKEDSFGLPAGYVQVTVDGGYSHHDAQGRFHSANGPAVVPAPGSREQARFAIEGEFVSRREFAEKTGRAPPPVTPREVEAPDDRSSARFGR